MVKPATEQDAQWNGSFWVQYLRDGKVVQGKDGWLFLANDSSDVLSQQNGTLTLSEDQLEDWRRLLESRIARLGEHGISYFFMVAPDTHSVYPEKLPEGFEPVAKRPVHRLVDHLEESGSPASVIYPLPELLAEKPTRQVYSAYDSHWTDFGALVAYTRLLQELGRVVPVRQIPMQHVLFETHLMPGELSYKLGIDGDVERLIGSLYARARLVADNCVNNRGSHVVIECEQAPPTTCVLFGDSFSPMLLRYMAESFRRLAFAHMSALDDELIERERPDVVVSVMAERFLIKVPDDARGETVEGHAQAKIEKGVLRPGLPMWDRRRKPVIDLVPVAAVEAIRAGVLARGGPSDGALVSTLAYAGLDPGSALGLRWRQVRDGALEIVGGDGGNRSVRLIEPLAEELEQLRLRSGGAPGTAVFAPESGAPGFRWQRWRRDVFGPAAEAAGVPGVQPADLRHCLAALLVREGASWEEIAGQAGRPPHQTLDLYGHLVDDLYRGGPLAAADQVRAAREAAGRALT